MKKLSRITLTGVAAIVMVTTLAACGGGNSGAQTPSSAPTTSAPVVVQASGAFNSIVTLPSGVAFTLNKQAVFTPTKFSAGQIDGQRFNSFEITAKNGAKTPLDLSALILTATTVNAGACVDIFDGQIGISGSPSDPIAPGASITFKWALSCAGKAGDPLNISLTTDGVTNVDVKDKLI